jgi:hypothetical protein
MHVFYIKKDQGYIVNGNKLDVNAFNSLPDNTIPTAID